MVLSEDDIIKLTKYKQHAKQKMQLDHLGIPYQERLDGSLVVYDNHRKPENAEPEMHL